MKSLYDILVTDIKGNTFDMGKFKGKVLLIVNTASKCGLTPQYHGLEALYQDFRDQDFEILGFPCDQFGNQEPGSEQEISNFCQINYGVSFPMFAKIAVNGKDAHPLFTFLKSKKSGLFGIEAIKWNFTKFLVSRTGQVIARYAPTTNPAKIKLDIMELLA